MSFIESTFQYYTLKFKDFCSTKQCQLSNSTGNEQTDNTTK